MKGVGAVRNASARFASRGGRVVCVHGGGSVHAPAAGGWGWSALRVAQGRPVNANRVALMAQPTEERLDERFVAEKPLPFRVVQIRCNECRPSAVAFLHQLEEDVRLLGFEIPTPRSVRSLGPTLAPRRSRLARRPVGN